MQEDRRIRKTRQAIVKAFIELLQEKSFQKITVKDIAERADIGKASFYRHFTDKYELAKYAVISKIDSFFQTMPYDSIDQMLESDNLEVLQNFIQELAPFRKIREDELNVDSLIKSYLAKYWKKSIYSMFPATESLTPITAKLAAAVTLELLDECSNKDVIAKPQFIKKQFRSLAMLGEFFQEK